MLGAEVYATLEFTYDSREKSGEGEETFKDFQRTKFGVSEMNYAV